MMLEEIQHSLDFAIDMAVFGTREVGNEAGEASGDAGNGAGNDVVDGANEAYLRLKKHLREGKVPYTWLREGEDDGAVSFVASIALRSLRSHCAYIQENYALFGSHARSFARDFQELDKAVRERRCDRAVLARSAPRRVTVGRAGSSVAD
jgi:hypothetical protein